MAIVKDVLVTGGGSALQFWSSSKESLRNYTLDGTITSMVVHPSTDSQYIYVATNVGTIYTFAPPGHENEYDRLATKTYPYDLYPNVLLWIGDSKIIAAGQPRTGFEP